MSHERKEWNIDKHTFKHIFIKSFTESDGKNTQRGWVKFKPHCLMIRILTKPLVQVYNLHCAGNIKNK